MKVRRVLETCLYVDDLDVAERFYTEVLGLSLLSRQPGRHVFLRCGEQMVLLFDPVACQQEDGEFPTHGARGAGHVAFAASNSQLPAWRARLVAAGIPIEREITWPGGGRSLYWRDPAGNSLELASPRIWGWPEEPSSPEETIREELPAGDGVRGDDDV